MLVNCLVRFWFFNSIISVKTKNGVDIVNVFNNLPDYLFSLSFLFTYYEFLMVTLENVFLLAHKNPLLTMFYSIFFCHKLNKE